jgi:hypothetical protein
MGKIKRHFAPRKLTEAELSARMKRDPSYPASFVWIAEDKTRSETFADETAEGAMALADQYFKGY